jgi:hypothetical protein
VARLGRKYDPDVLTSLRNRIEQAIDAQSENATQRRRAWQQFSGQADESQTDGNNVTSGDVNSMVTAVCAQMVIAFSTDTIVSFAANNAEDETSAKAESRAVNKIIVEDNGGFRKILEGVQNALMYRTGYLKAWWDVDKVTATVPFDGVEADELPVLVEDEQGIERRLIDYDEDKKRARVEVTQTTKRLRVRAVNNERFFVDPDWDEQELDGCGLCGEVHYKTRDELSRMGIPWEIVKALPAVQKGDGAEGSAPTQGYRWGSKVAPVVMQMDVCRVYEGYARFTFKESDDRAYLYKCWIGDRTAVNDGWLLDPEPVSRVPYACGTAFPIANRHNGEALSEKLYQIEAGKTQLLRQWLDNVQNCSFGRFGAVVGQVEAADIMTPRAGGPVRMKAPTSIVPIPVIDVGPSIAAALEKFDAMRSERGGASLDMIGAEMQIASDSAHGTERVYASKEILVSYMARNLAESMVRRLFLLGHAELRDGDGGPINLKVGEQWQTMDPAQWQPRTHCNVNVAPSFGERMLQAQTLGQGLQFYSQALAGGLEGEIVTKPGLYKMATDWLRLNLIADPESYFLDPTSPQAQQAGQQKADAQQQQMQMQAEILALPEKVKAQIDQYKSDQDTQFKYFNAVLDALLEQSKLETEGMVNVVNARTEAEALTRAAAGNAGGAGTGAGAKRANGNGAGAGNGRNGGGGNRGAAKGN